MWPYGFGSRLLFTAELLPAPLVSVTKTSPVRGCTATHSGRCRRVAPTASAAMRVRISTSAWSAQPFAAVERTDAVHERQPLAAAVVVELRDVQRAVVERALALRAQLPPGSVADELVQVVAVLVVAAVDDDAALALGAGRALVLDAAERGALHGRRGRVERIDLDHPAEVVELVAVLRQVEARLGLVPVVAEADVGHAVARLERRARPASVSSVPK